ncbi:glycosyltransferase [Clostridium thermosuccinogenes]|uniref:glycosyltransferase n=1 Tax=Clostridium thermosuccinogenes TaxID=84032 RepID=UPI000CCBFC64|nr:glycosyltransferase [Pseudoclostridium thermosuccinogenes]PNT91119.1 glycosyl transferase [Pseudoclostridium thermosuccinogenes]
MKKVLMIAYSFPPAGGPGVQRTSKFVKYLRDFGWEPVVFTRDTENMPLRDDSLLKDIPEGIATIRVKSWDISAHKGIRGLIGKVISRKILIPDSERLWQIFEQKKAAEAVINEKIDMIYTTSLPYSSHLMGLYLKKRFPSIPWVADFRDEWTNNPYILDNPYNPLRMRIERKMERNVLKAADCLITNTPVMLRNFIEKNPDLELKDKFFAISNGYDSDDFKHIASEKQKNDKFTITYTGSFYGRRKPDIFFEALHQLLSEGKIDRKKVLVKLIGNFKQDHIKQLLDRYMLQEVVAVSPYMKHDECISNMIASDCLLLIEGGGPGAEAFYTGKVFEYMTTGRPIIAIIPAKGAAAQVIRETKTGYISDVNDVQGAKDNIIKLYTAWLENENIFSPDFNAIRRFDRRALTEELSKVFEKAESRVKR